MHVQIVLMQSLTMAMKRSRSTPRTTPRVFGFELLVAVEVGHGFAACDRAARFHIHARFLRAEQLRVRRYITGQVSSCDCRKAVGCKNDHAFCRHAFVKTPAGVPVAASSSQSSGVSTACSVTSSPHMTIGTPDLKTICAASGSRVDVELCRGGYVAAGGCSRP